MRIRRILTSAALVAGLSAASALTGTPQATATQWDCTFYLFVNDYSGKIVEIGCASGADGNQVICEGSLRIAGVPDVIGREACRRAALP
jgi:hypothetical protein